MREAPITSQLAGMRLVVALWLTGLVILVRVALCSYLDYTVEHLRGDLLWEHAVQHLLLAARRAWWLVVALAFLPRGQHSAVVILRSVVCWVLTVVLLSGLPMYGVPDDEIQYQPGWWSLKGKLGWTCIAVLALFLCWLDRWSMSARRFFYRMSPVALFAVTALVFLLVGAGVKGVSMVVEARRILMVVQGPPPGGDLVQRLHRGEARVEGGTAEVVSILPGSGAGCRPSVALSSGARVTFEVEPAGRTSLRFACGVDRAAARLLESKSSGQDDLADLELKFRVALQGEEAYHETVAPMEEGQQRWFEEELDLTPWDGSTVEIQLSVEGRGSGHQELIAGFGRPLLVRAERIPRREGSAGRPNVVLVVVDSLRADHVGAYGYDRPTTPFLDGLAAESLVYERAWSPSSVTWSSVASILTGLYPQSHGVAGVDQGFLMDELDVVTEVLQRHGITTAGWSGNPLTSQRKNFHQGFEVWREFNFRPGSLRPGSLLTREFRDHLKRYEDYQFFAYLHFAEPRAPYYPPARCIEKFTDSSDLSLNRDLFARAEALERGEEGQAFDDATLDQAVDLYDAEICAVDEEIRRVQRFLSMHELWDRTILIVAGSNGEEFQEHGGLLHGGSLYEEQLHVPLLVRVPGQAAQRIAEPVDLTRIAATVLELTGCEDSGTRSPPLPPWSEQTPPRAFAHVRLPDPGLHARPLSAVRTPEDKLIVGSKSCALFRLESDPREQASRHLAEPGRLEELRAELSRWQEQCERAALAAPAERMESWVRRLYRGEEAEAGSGQ